MCVPSFSTASDFSSCQYRLTLTKVPIYIPDLLHLYSPSGSLSSSDPVAPCLETKGDHAFEGCHTLWKPYEKEWWFVNMGSTCQIWLIEVVAPTSWNTQQNLLKPLKQLKTNVFTNFCYCSYCIGYHYCVVVLSGVHLVMWSPLLHWFEKDVIKWTLSNYLLLHTVDTFSHVQCVGGAMGWKVKISLVCTSKSCALEGTQSGVFSWSACSIIESANPPSLFIHEIISVCCSLMKSAP